ncbi:uncharacterized protein LOC128853977 [Cuculus canorus]|uniref:uncharacterized protein LOC128853977 n=1 Tax=Cuculus canorus TaxID=55661 RepID=UPI0023AA93D1|nr:uncharacterized protein LOC128853977 [Cuculus canorus]
MDVSSEGRGPRPGKDSELRCAYGYYGTALWITDPLDLKTCLLSIPQVLFRGEKYFLRRLSTLLLSTITSWIMQAMRVASCLQEPRPLSELSVLCVLIILDVLLEMLQIQHLVLFGTFSNQSQQRKVTCSGVLTFKCFCGYQLSSFTLAVSKPQTPFPFEKVCQGEDDSLITHILSVSPLDNTRKCVHGLLLHQAAVVIHSTSAGTGIAEKPWLTAGT